MDYTTLIFDSNSDCISSGSFRTLLRCLYDSFNAGTKTWSPNYQFNNQFLAMHEYLLSSEDLMRHLTQAYGVFLIVSQLLSYASHSSTETRLRITALVLNWIKNFPCDFETAGFRFSSLIS